ncbi:hypothetical protein JCM9279_006874 [Rhodotorula babjevae]
MASAPPPLPDLEPVTKLSAYVTRILGQNPGKFTLQGTNSYLVHHPRSPSLLLVDTTGPSSSSPLEPSATAVYTSHLLSALAQHPTQPARVTDVVLTHWHGDHVRALVPTLEALARRAGEREGEQGRASPPRVWKVPCAADGGVAWASERGKDAEIEHELEHAVREGWVLPAATTHGEGEGEGRAPSALRPLVDGQRFSLGGAGGAPELVDVDGDGAPVELEVVHTPGHTSDSVCLVLRRTDPSSSAAGPSSLDAAQDPPLALFTADTVLGHGSSVFASLSAYMASLAALSALLPCSTTSSSPSPAGIADALSSNKVPLYPGHGAPCDDAAAKMAEYRHHREEREAQVVEALKGRAQEDAEAISAGDLTTLIYPPSLPASLHPAATHSLLQHLGKLHEEGRVERVPAAAPDEGAAEEGESEGTRKAPEGWFDGWRWVGEREGEVKAAGAAGQVGDEAPGRL